LLRLQSDERLIAFVRRGNHAAFEALVHRYEARLLAFCRHLLGSREDAEDVLQDAFAAAFNAILADDRPINVRPWLYRIARNRCLNHLRRVQAVGVDSMDVHFSENGASTADKVHHREEFRLLVGDIQDLPETQRTALLLREMDALSYDQIAEAMETTVPSVKSLLVRARVSLAEAAEARQLSCEQVRMELGEVAEGLKRRPSPLVRRHLRGCDRCSTFRVQLRDTNKALAALLPVAPLLLAKKLLLAHLGHTAGAGSTAGSTAAAGTTAAAGSSVVAGSTAGGFVSAGVGAVATKACAGLAAAAIVTAGAVEVGHVSSRRTPRAVAVAPAVVVPETRGGDEYAQRAFDHATASSSIAKPSAAQTSAKATKDKATKPGGKLLVAGLPKSAHRTKAALSLLQPSGPRAENQTVTTILPTTLANPPSNANATSSSQTPASSAGTATSAGAPASGAAGTPADSSSSTTGTPAGTPGTGTPGDPAGSGTPGSSTPGSSTPVSTTPSGGTPTDSGTPGSSTPSSGTPGSGTPGSGTPGSGTPSDAGSSPTGSTPPAPPTPPTAPPTP
jgi:RNA polymerase sigma factor (sigma-70 family)